MKLLTPELRPERARGASFRAIAAVIAGPVLVATVISGCTAASADPSALSLRDTKVPAQLLRNESAQRLIEGTDESVAEQEDSSVPCKSGAEDPEELYRSWRSTLLARVPKDSAIGVDQFTGALATSFAVDGWILKEDHGTGSALKVTTMTKPSSIVTLRFTSAEDTGEGASIYIEATGPCVLTGGPESDEVTALEG